MHLLRILRAFFLLCLFESAAAEPPTADNPNSVIQIDFSRRLADVDIPECARNQIVYTTMADYEIASLLPQRSSSGLYMLDRLEHFLSETPEADPDKVPLSGDSSQDATKTKCEMPTLLSHELHVGSPELQSYLRAARLRWLLDRCFRFSDVGVDDWRYELCIGCAIQHGIAPQSARLVHCHPRSVRRRSSNDGATESFVTFAASELRSGGR